MKAESTREPLIVAVGRISLRPGASRLRFILYTLTALWQARRAAGCVHASTNGADGAHYSMSVWQSEKAMRAYALSGAHLRAMRAARAIAVEARFCHWPAESVPGWPEALARFQTERHRRDRAA